MSDKILFFGRLSTPLFNETDKSEHGGAEIQLFNIANSLSRKGYDISFILGGSYGPVSYNNIKLRYIRKLRGISSILSNFFLIIDILKEIKPKKVIFRSSLSDNLFFIFFSFFFKFKTIFMIAHDKQLTGQHHKGLPFDILNTILTSYSSIVICQSNFQLEILDNKKISSSIVRSIHKIKDYGIREKQDIGVLWVGRDIAWKNVNIIKKISKSYPNIKFSLLGLSGQDTDNVKFLGRVKYDESWKYFKNCNFLINTSIAEGFPNTFIQAWMCNKPVVSLNVNPDNLINKYRVGFCANGNLKLFSAAIYFFHKNSYIKKNLDSNFKKIVEEVFDPNLNVSEIEKIVK